MHKLLNYKSPWNLQHLLLLLLITCACYWPFTFGIFSAKNDNIVQFLPIRFHVSEALRNGHLPLWSPYMYLGYPIHGDMQGGAWNPAVWILSLFGRYTLTSLHAEILIGIFLSGVGMYRLLGAIKTSPFLKLLGAGAYLMCGFITDVAGSNLPFLWAASYTPFVFVYYYELLSKPTTKKAIKSAIPLCLLFVSGYPSFFILVNYILLAALLVVVTKLLLQEKYVEIKLMLTSNIITAVTFIGISAVAIISYLHILPFYERANGVSLQQSFENDFDFFCTISFVLPAVASKGHIYVNTDLISRNAYFNLLILFFLCTYIWTKKSLLSKFVFTGTIFFYFFSLGSATPLQEFCYKILPLMNTFRHPSNARLFVIIGGIFLGIFSIEYFNPKYLFFKYLKIVAWVFLFGLLAAAIISLPNLDLEIAPFASSDQSFRITLKDFLENLSSHTLLIVSSIIQIIFILLFLLLVTRKKINNQLFAFLFLLNSFVLAQLNIPFTMASQLPPSVINNILKAFPEGYPIPDKKVSIRSSSFNALSNLKEVGISGFYNKKINFTDVHYTPTFMLPIQAMVSDSIEKKIVLSNPYAFVADLVVENEKITSNRVIVSNAESLFNKTTGPFFNLTKFWNNGFEFQIKTANSRVFCLQQLFLPGWHCRIDKKSADLILVNGAFMAVQVPKGVHTILFIYSPFNVIVGFWISLTSCVVVIFLFIVFFRKT